MIEVRHYTYSEIAENYLKSFSYLYDDNAQCELIRAVAIGFDTEQITMDEFLKLKTSDYNFDNFLHFLIYSHFGREDDGTTTKKFFIKFFLSPEHLLNNFKHVTCKIISELVPHVTDVNSLYDLLISLKFDETELIKICIKQVLNAGIHGDSFPTDNFKHFINLCGNKMSYYEYFYTQLFFKNNSDEFHLPFLKLACENKIDFLNDERIKRLLLDQKIGLKTKFNIDCVSYLLSISDDYLYNIEDCLKGSNLDPANLFSLYKILNSRFYNKYLLDAIQIGKKTLEDVFTIKQEIWLAKYETKEPVSGQTLSTYIGEFLVLQNEKEAFQYFSELTQQSDFFQIGFIKFLDKTFEKDCLKFLIFSLVHHKHILQDNYFEALFEILEKYDSTPYIDSILDFAVNQANKESRLLSCKYLAQYSNIIFEKAVDLLRCKTNTQRMVGAIILLNINNSESNRVLLDAVDNEKNDDTRDIIVDALQKQIFPDHFSIQNIKEVISKAAKRNKLNKWNEKSIEESSLPTLYWSDGTILSTEDVRFLFYRIQRSKGLNSDLEARIALRFVDKKTSETFAKLLLKTFNDCNQDIKFKHFLTLSAMLGGNESVVSFNALFKKAIVDKRARLAEIALESMAVIGNSKALRAIEVISRKMASKKPRLSQLAIEALEATAEELGITKDQLEDRIVPDFDFDGVYRNFTIGDDEYRAFVANDFTIHYMDEDNKIRKSLPKETDKDTKLFFTEMGKELKDVVRNQVGRLEKYLTTGRLWSMEEWFTSYINHPIMSVFSQKLLWYSIGNDGLLKVIFVVQEDTSLTNIEDDEIELSEYDQIGLLHPIFINQSMLEAWREKLYNQNFKTLISQLDRRVFFPNDNELESNICKTFDGKLVPKKADFVKTFMEKRGWIKEPSDGGSLIFYKIFHNINLKVEPYIEGVAAWYQENSWEATVHDINFYMYKPSDKFLIKKIPPIIYSEVMKDFQDMLDSQ